MRLRKVKNAAVLIEASEYLILEPEIYKSHFNDVFKNNNPLHLEIGMGKGQFLIGMAKMYPNINFVGIEKFDSVMVRTVQKLNAEKIDNLRLIKMDALEIEKVFDKEIDVIYLNFSDPWPKDRHARRRLTSSDFLKRYDQIFKKEKNIIMKTDNRKLFEYSLQSFTDYGYKIKKLSLDLYQDNIKNNVATEYEEKYMKKGPIYMIKVQKGL